VGSQVTIRDVAKLADVSVATVSAVLNDNKYVSPELKRRVRKAINQLAYRPNLVARSLKLNQSNAIGLVFTNISSAIWPPLVRTVQKISQAKGFDTILVATDEDPEIEKQAIHTLLDKQVAGILIGPTPTDRFAHLVEAAELIPIIAVDRPAPWAESVITDNEEICYQAAMHLVEHGRKRIGIVAIQTAGANSAARLAGYKRALEACGQYDPRLTREADFLGSNSFDLAIDLLQDSGVDALMTTSQSTSIAALRAANALGRRIPNDLALFCYDDAPWMEAILPALSTVRQPIEAMAKLAAERLFARIEGAERIAGNHILHSSLIIRRSCGC
jgi:LacI family transcriptional regulator